MLNNIEISLLCFLCFIAGCMLGFIFNKDVDTSSLFKKAKENPGKEVRFSIYEPNNIAGRYSLKVIKD